MNRCLQVGDLVLEKVGGLPHWPARISRLGPNDRKQCVHYDVRYFGNHENGFLADDNVKPFIEDPRTPDDWPSDVCMAMEDKNVTTSGTSFKDEMDVENPSSRLSISERNESDKENEDACEDDSVDVNWSKGAARSGRDLPATADYADCDLIQKEETTSIEKSALNLEAPDAVPVDGSSEKLTSEYHPAEISFVPPDDFPPSECSPPKKPQLLESLPTARPPRDVATERLAVENYLIERTDTLDRLVKQFDAVKYPTRGCYYKVELTRRIWLEKKIRVLLKQILRSIALRRASPLVLLKNPWIISLMEQLVKGRCGEAISIVADTVRNRLAAIFGVQGRNDFIKAYILRRREFDEAVAHLPTEQRLLLTSDPTLHDGLESTSLKRRRDGFESPSPIKRTKPDGDTSCGDVASDMMDSCGRRHGGLQTSPDCDADVLEADLPSEFHTSPGLGCEEPVIVWETFVEMDEETCYETGHEEFAIVDGWALAVNEDSCNSSFLRAENTLSCLKIVDVRSMAEEAFDEAVEISSSSLRIVNVESLEDILSEAVSDRGIQTLGGLIAFDGRHVTINDDGSLSWPVALFYAASNLFEVVEQFHEEATLESHFGKLERVRTRRDKYDKENVRIFFEVLNDSVPNREFVSVPAEKSLKEVLHHSKFTVNDGVVNLLVFAEPSESDEYLLPKILPWNSE